MINGKIRSVPLNIFSSVCNISVSVGGKVTHLTDSYDVYYLQIPTHILNLPEHTYYKLLLKLGQKQL